MKKSFLINFAGIAAAAVLIIAGYFIPRRLLTDLEGSEIGNEYALSVIADSAEEPIPSYTPEPTELPGSVDYRASGLFSTLYRIERATDYFVREPHPGELEMGEAMERAREEFEKLFTGYHFLSKSIFDFKLLYAALRQPYIAGEQQRGDGFAIWNIVFADDEPDSTVSIMIDAVYGTIYSVSVDLAYTVDGIDPLSMLVSYANYLGLATDGGFRAELEKEPVSTELMIRIEGIKLRIELSSSEYSSFIGLRAGPDY